MSENDTGGFEGPPQPLEAKNPFTRAKEAIKRVSSNIIYGPPTEFPADPIMPPKVDFALQHKDGVLRAPEIESLINNGFTDLSTYSILKVLSGQPEKQMPFLESFVDLTVDSPGDTQKLKSLQEETFFRDIKDTDVSLTGTKVAQIVRQGTSLWSDKFTEVARDVKEMEKEVLPVYIGYAGVLGLRQGIETFTGTDRKMMLMIPDWVEDAANKDCGYMITPDAKAGERVAVVAKDFERPEEFVFVDDTRRNGAHAQVMWDFWTGGSGEPLLDSRLKIVNVAPKNELI